jgi:hypothetical protein
MTELHYLLALLRGGHWSVLRWALRRNVRELVRHD